MKKSMKKIVTLLAVVSLVFSGVFSVANVSAQDGEPIRYGKAAGPYTELFEDAIIPILEEQGYTFEVVEFSDLLQNNTSLAEGDTDVNVEQHTAYMENFNEAQGANLVALTPIPTVPAGIFSDNHEDLEGIADGATIAVPNDPSNTARAYGLLQKAGWITIDPEADASTVTQDDITENPYNIEFTEMDTNNIPRTLGDFDYAVITGSIVHGAGIDPSTALLQEDIAPHLILQVVVKEEDAESDWAQAIVAAYQSEEFAAYIEENNDGLWYVPEELTGGESTDEEATEEETSEASEESAAEEETAEESSTEESTEEESAE